MFGGRKKRRLQVGEKNGAFKWAKKTVPSCGRKKRCLHVGEKNGAFKILKTGFSEVCVNMLWDSLNFNGTGVYLL